MPDDQSVNINFSSGLDTKDDPWQVPIGKFLSLTNSVFTTGKRLTKRNGYGLLTTTSGASTVTTFSGNLVSIGNTLNLFSEDTNSVINTGYFQPLKLIALSMVRRATSQTTVDVAVAPNGLACNVWLDSDGNSYYQINDSVTGGTIIPAASITTGTDVAATMPRVFVLGQYFFITYLATVSSSPTLRYIAIPYASPTHVIGPTTISTNVANLAAAYDGVVAKISPDILYLAWNDNSGGIIRVTSITSALAIGSIITIASTVATLISATWDYALNNLWLSIYKASANTIHAIAYNQALTVLRAKTSVVTSITLNNGLTSTANNGVVTIFYEVSNFYSYDNALRTDYIAKNTCNLAGTAGTAAVVLRSVGLGSKAVYLDGLSYMLAVYGSAYQPTYFLINQSGSVIAKLAYSNGGGYIINQILPQINNSTDSDGEAVFQIGYLFKDFLASIANPQGPVGSDIGTDKSLGAANTIPLYTQNGINLVKVTLNNSVTTAETGGILHMGAGFPWMFDGVKPVEHQFHLWPDAVEVTPYVSLTPTGTVSDSVTPTVITSVSSVAHIVAGMKVSGTGIPANTTVVSVGVSTVTMSAAATSAHSDETITFTGSIVPQVNSVYQTFYYQSIYFWIDGQGNPQYSAPSVPVGFVCSVDNPYTFAEINTPTCRLTYKTTNKVRILTYRWSTANQNFYEIVSLQSAPLNDPSVDSVLVTDLASDATILGNSLLYTTGGVVEDVAAPSSSVFTMFDDRLWVVDADNPSLLWYSKQVIQGTGVEFSDLFTFYAAPSLGAQGSTGPITVIAKMDVELIIFRKNAIDYVNGAGPDNTGANSTYSQPTFITATVGCDNPNSVVVTDVGLMFQSDKGIWLLGRNLQTSYIGAPVEAYNSYRVTSATVIPGTTQVRFTISNGMTLMYDYFWGQWGTFDHTPAISATLYQGLHTYLNQYGQIAQETPGLYLDLDSPVLMSFTTSWVNLASLQGYERFYDFYILAQYLSPHILNAQIAYDYNPSIQQSSIIRPTNFSPSTPSPFGVPTPVGGPYNKEQWRIHTKRQLCESFQLTVTEVYDPSKGVEPGAGFTMSGLTARIGIKKSTRPIPAQNAVG